MSLLFGDYLCRLKSGLRYLSQFLIILVFLIITGCATNKLTMPTMDLPPEPQKPAINSSVIVQNNTPWVAYSLNDSLKLYEYLLRKDSYEEKLIYRINQMNSLWQGGK